MKVLAIALEAGGVVVMVAGTINGLTFVVWAGVAVVLVGWGVGLASHRRP